MSQRAFVQDALRRAKGDAGDACRSLCDSVRSRSVVHTDDTGWRVGGDAAFLMAFETDEATVYQIRFHHLNGEVRELIHADNGGVMVKDRGRSFRSSNLSGVRQRKCMAHVIRSVSEVVQT